MGFVVDSFTMADQEEAHRARSERWPCMVCDGGGAKQHLSCFDEIICGGPSAQQGRSLPYSTNLILLAQRITAHIDILLLCLGLDTQLLLC